MRLILNADDYGKDLSTTCAIAQCFQKGLCSSTTIMATGNAFEEAVELAKNSRFNNNIGIHLNLTEGKPLTESIRYIRKICDEEGNFNKELAAKIFNPYTLSYEEKKAVATELRAQIEGCKRSGLQITHADSHHHVHTRWDLWQITKTVLKEYGIYKTRISRNCGEGISELKRFYKIIFNNQLKISGFDTTKYFGNINDIKYLYSTFPSIFELDCTVEVMLHPTYGSKYELLDSNNKNLQGEVKEVYGWEDAISYLELL